MDRGSFDATDLAQTHTANWIEARAGMIGIAKMIPQNWVSTTRWVARIAGLVYFIFMSWFILAHAFSADGLPNLLQAPSSVQLGFIALFLMVTGAAVGWKWEGVAAVMILVGCLIWVVVERHLPWPPGFMPVVGLLYAFTWWSTKRTLSQPRGPS